MKRKKSKIKSKDIAGLFRDKMHFVLAALGFAAIAALSMVFATLYLGKAIDAIAGEKNVDFNTLSNCVIVLLFLYFLYSVFQWALSIMANKIAHSTSLQLRIRLFDKLNRLPISFFDTNPHGDIVQRFTNDLDNLSDAISLSLTSFLTGVVTVLAALVVMIYLNWKITLIILLSVPLCYAVAYIVTKFSQNTYKVQQNVTGELSALVTETVGNQKTIIAFGYEDETIAQFEEINKQLFNVGKKAHFASALVNPAIRCVDHLAYAAVGVVGGLIAISSGVSAGMVSSFLIYSSQFAKPFNEISGIIGNIQMGIASLGRVMQILQEQDEKADDLNAKTVVNVEGKIQFSNVSFSYKKDVPLIQNLSIFVKPGNVVAIVGPTGAGKSTLVNLLMRFYDPCNGAIFLDGKDIQQITKDSLRNNFGMVLQETWLMDGTIRDNILYGNPAASVEEMLTASKGAHAHSFIKNLANGYDTRISDAGDILSVGEKQLVTIARIMLAQPELLILDEATSSIDTLTEIRVQKAFAKLMKGRTSFVIAHRLSTIVSADTILVMNKGSIVEQGTHKDLLAACGFYAELYNSQFS